MKSVIFVFSACLLAAPVHADIFKCIVDGKSTYQASPCKTEKEETALKIKTLDPNDSYRPAYSQSDLVRRDREQKLFDAQMATQQAEINRRQAADEAYQRRSLPSAGLT